VKIDHYENFPVASWLCPARLRPAVAAIYHFARSADDIADEGNATPAERLADLAAVRADLAAIASGQPHSARWPQVFDPLRGVLQTFALPTVLLAQLLDAFEQDVRYSASHQRYPTDAELLDYCTRSANPVGRLLLHLYGIDDAFSLTQSDQICSALQLINFWQDIGVDLRRGRWYPSLQAMQQHAVQEADLLSDQPSANASRMVAACCRDARALMLQGAGLALRVPGRAGWELRLVVQGGMRILEKIEAIGHESWRTRVRIGALDWPLLLWRAWRMG